MIKVDFWPINLPILCRQQNAAFKLLEDNHLYVNFVECTSYAIYWQFRVSVILHWIRSHMIEIGCLQLKAFSFPTNRQSQIETNKWIKAHFLTALSQVNRLNWNFFFYWMKILNQIRDFSYFQFNQRYPKIVNWRETIGHFICIRDKLTIEKKNYNSILLYSCISFIINYYSAGKL